MISNISIGGGFSKAALFIFAAMHAPFVLLDGKTQIAGNPLLHPSNRSFRYGEGLFETMRLYGGTIPLWPWHRQRLQQGLACLELQLPAHTTCDHLMEQAIQLARKNKIDANARLRITLWRGDGGLWDEVAGPAHYCIEAWPAPLPPRLNTNGLVLGIYTQGWKSCDAFSNLKSNNYLLYAMAARHGKQQRWNDAVILNQHRRVCDTTIANLFIRVGETWITPALTEGCVAGVMRSYLLQQPHWQVEEGTITTEALLAADEVVLTNAFYGMRWVQQIGTQTYAATGAAALFRHMIQPLFS